MLPIFPLLRRIAWRLALSSILGSWIFGFWAEAAEPIVDAKSLWAGIDPQVLPLDVETISRSTELLGEIEKLRFTSEISEGVPARVFAIRGVPARGPNGSRERLPGILHIHGGGQTASLEWVRFWVARGYTCVSFDFCGPWADRTEVTDWGPIKHANMAQAAGGFQVHPTPRESSWFHWALASRRALNLLAEHPQTDPDRLGIFGISMGGTLCWLVAASDDRVKTAVPIYGCGYNHDDRRERFGFGKLTDDLKLYKQTLSPEAHAPLIKMPVLFLNSTNDFHGPMDFAFDTLGAVKGPVRWAFTPRTNHHIAPREGVDLPMWMDWQLRGYPAWPKSPVVNLNVDAQGIPQATVYVDDHDDVKSVELFYSLGDRLPAARYWRSVELSETTAGLQYSTPIKNLDEPLLAFANVTYQSGVTLSSNMPTVLPRDLPATPSSPVRATLEWTPELADALGKFDNWFFTAGSTDPTRKINYLVTETDDGGPYLTHDPELLPHGGPVQFSTHIVGDPQHIGRPGDALVFEYRGDFDEKGLAVRAIENDWSPLSKTYAAQIPPLPPGEGRGEGAPPPETKSPNWRQVTLSLNQFKTTDGAELKDWSKVQRLELLGNSKGRVGFRGFRFQEKPL